MAARFLHMTKELTDFASIGSASEGKITCYIQYVCARNLQNKSEMLVSGWTFSLAMDMFTHIFTSVLDIRIRLFACGAIHNFQLYTIPMFSSHTGEAIFLYSERALDVICPNWRDLIIFISTKGEQKMTDRSQGIATRFERVANPGFFRLWCGLHQLDIVLQQFFRHQSDDEFYSLLVSISS